MSKNFGQVLEKKENTARHGTIQARNYTSDLHVSDGIYQLFERTYGWHCHWLRKVQNIDVNYSTPRLYHCNSPLALLDF